ncbi:DUF6114 domain-containing protein [Streptomyces sp. enrichment culture]|uniref:DUF6114 domain-containing protein n=1 Tax=Streptomyces sp. enrichment culture TaxID=1795815 RepID=UPI003F54B732
MPSPADGATREPLSGPPDGSVEDARAAEALDRPAPALSGRAPLGLWGRWRRWRRSRPFWGGLLTILAGAEICAIPLAPMEVMLHQGIAGVPSVLLGIVMIMLGISVWASPHYRSLAGVVTTLIAAAALVMSNLGGFLIGTLVGILGGAMMFAWQPVAPRRTEPAPPSSGASEHPA